MKEYKETTKENALYNFIVMTENSWTFNKMTSKEKERLYDVLNDYRTTKALRGTYYERWDVLQAIYGAYLSGLGYTDFNWRSDDESVPF